MAKTILYICSLCGKQVERREQGKPPNRCKACNHLWSSCRTQARSKFGREVTDDEIMAAVIRRLERRQARLEAGQTRGTGSSYRGCRLIAHREAIRSTFNSSELMRAPAEKAAKMFNQILSGERCFTI
jgi:hypothetical protein